MFQPFLAALEGYGIAPANAIDQAGYQPELLEKHETAPVVVWYRLAEICATLTGDVHFGYKVGRDSALTSLPNLARLSVKPMSLGDQLAFIVADAARLSNLGRYLLTNDGEQCVLRLVRRFRPPLLPAQIDAFGFGFMEQLLRFSLGDALDGSRLKVRISQPDALPPWAIAACKPVKGSASGPAYRFPSQWLTFVAGMPMKIGMPQSMEADFLASVREIIRLNLSRPVLNATHVARLCGISRRTLQQRLQSTGTTFREELLRARMEEAQRIIEETNLPIAEVAQAVGYQQSSSFIRAFKKARGTTPLNLRKQGS